MSRANEWNFDGLVGPTHNYAGLSLGNVASLKNAKVKAYPKQAALQGLKKMKSLADLGFKQAVLAPQQRPDLITLRELGFSGSVEDILRKAQKQAPHILASCFSASSMWTANAATISPSADTHDGKLHITPANLANKFHRSLEPQVTGNILKAIFNDPEHFVVHKHLPQVPQFGDEGAANHTRFCREYGDLGVEFFVYGFYGFDPSKPFPKKFPARQSRESSEAIARMHGLTDDRVVFAQQNPDVIDQGVFHNDVISVGNRNVLFTHEFAFLDKEKVYSELRTKVGSELFHIIEVPDTEVSVQDAVESYLFNSQLLSQANGEMVLVCPEECRTNQRVNSYLESLCNSSEPISQVIFMDVKQSMQNGGGPACLRLRVVLNEDEAKAMNQGIVLTDNLYTELVSWVNRNYREELSESDFIDPALIQENYKALDELTQIMNLGSVYPFQKQSIL